MTQSHQQSEKKNPSRVKKAESKSQPVKPSLVPEEPLLVDSSSALNPNRLLHLQKTVGNQAVNRLLVQRDTAVKLRSASDRISRVDEPPQLTADALKSAFAAKFRAFFDPKSLGVADLQKVTRQAASGLGLVAAQVTEAADAASAMDSLTLSVQVGGGTQSYGLLDGLLELHGLLAGASGSGITGGALGAGYLHARVTDHASEFVALSIYEKMEEANPSLTPAKSTASAAFTSLFHDLSRITAALQDTRSLYMLELEATVSKMVELREAEKDLQSNEEREVNRQQRSEAARRALLINDHLLEMGDKGAPSTALDTAVGAQLGKINQLAKTEKETAKALGDKRSLLAPQPLNMESRVQDPFFKESGLAEEGVAQAIEPQAAFPEQTGRFMSSAQKGLSKRIRDQSKELDNQLDRIAPLPDQAAFTPDEFEGVYKHWYSLFSRERELQSMTMQISLQTWESLHELTGIATTKAWADTAMGVLRVQMMEQSLAMIGMDVRTSLDRDFQTEVKKEKLTRSQKMTGKGASDAGYESGELYGKGSERTHGGEVSSRRGLQSTRQQETAQQFSLIAGLPAQLQALGAAQSGLTDKVAPIRGLKKVDAKEGWSYLVTIRGEGGQVLGYEHKVATPEVSEFLMAYRQHQQSQIPHVQSTTVRQPTGADTYRNVPAPIGRGSGAIRPLEEGRVPRTEAAPIGSKRPPSGTDKLQGRLLQYLDAYFKQEDPAPRIIALFKLMDAEHKTGAVLKKMLDPGEIAKVVAKAALTGAGLSALSQLGPIGQALSLGLGKAMKLAGGNDISAAMGVAKFFELALNIRSFHGARTLGYMGKSIVNDIKQVFEAVLSEGAGKVGAAAGKQGVDAVRRRLINRPPRTIAEAAEIGRALGDADPQAREAIMKAVDGMIAERRAAIGPVDQADTELDVLVAFRNSMHQRSQLNQRLDPFTTPVTGKEPTQSKMPIIGRGLTIREPAELAKLKDALGPLKDQVDFVEDPTLSTHETARTVRVYYLGKRLRVHVGPKATAEDVRRHLPVIKDLQRYQGVRGRLRSLLDDLLIAIGAKAESEKHGTLGAEAKREIEKLGNIRDELIASEKAIEKSRGRIMEGKMTRDQIAQQIAEIDGQIIAHARNFASTDIGRGHIAAELSGGKKQIDPQTRRVKVSRPDLLAQFEGLATRKMPAIVADVLKNQGSTATRKRLKTLQTQFEKLRQGIGDRDLTPAERKRAMKLLGEARDLARKDFSNVQRAIWRRLRADPELKKIVAEMKAAGDVELGGKRGTVRVLTQWDDGREGYQALEIEHRTRLSDNPWRYNDPNNLLVTDSPLNQQYLEALRRHGGIWATDETEMFITRHKLTEQTSGFGLPGTQ